MNPRFEKTEIDLSQPILPIHYIQKENDCFGIEWDPLNNYCRKCKDIDFCGSVYRKFTLQKRIEQITTKEGPFIDETDFNEVNVKLLLEMIEKGLNVESLFDYIQTTSNCKSDELVFQWLQLFLNKNNFKSSKGKIIKNAI